MKFLASILIFILPMIAVAEERLPIQMSGQFRFRGEGNSFTDFLTDRDFFGLRLRARFTLKTEDYELVFTPQFAKIMGAPIATSGTTTDPTLGVHEAYGNYRLVPDLKFSVGRMVLSYGDELLIGALEWNTIGRSFDGIRARYEFLGGWIDALAIKLNENNSSATATDDQDLFGLYSHFDSSPWLQTVEIYSFDKKSGVGNLFASGLRNAAKHGGFDRRLELTFQTGDALLSQTSPFQIDAELGYCTSAQVRLAAEFFVAGVGYDQFYPTAHKWLGYADVLGRRNLKGIALHIEIPTSNGLTTKLDYHYFERFDLSAPIYKIDGLTALGSPSRSSASNVGSELDLSLSYVLNASSALSGGSSILFPGAYLRDQSLDKTPRFYFVQLENKF